MDMKTFKKTFNIICDSCGEFTHTDTQYCEKCGAQSLREATKEDYEKYETIADKISKDSREETGVIEREEEKVKKKADKVKKDTKRAKKDADKAERKSEKDAEKAEKKSEKDAEKAEKKAGNM